MVVTDDPACGTEKRLRGWPLEAVLEAHADLPESPDGYVVEFVATDGYRATVPLEELPTSEGILASRDLGAPEDRDWSAFAHGEGQTTPAPFYLVWPSTTPGAGHRPRAYQVVRIGIARAAELASPPFDVVTVDVYGWDLFAEEQDPSIGPEVGLRGGGMARRWRTLLISAAILMVVGCGETSTSGNESGERGERNGKPADEVRVLNESARQSVTEFSFDKEANEGKVRFDASSAYAQNLEAGRIMASRPIEGPAPAGMLQRVKSVTEQDGAIVATTRQATLAESFERADFSITRELQSGDIERTQTLQPGVRFETRGQDLSKPFELDFQRVLIDGDGDKDTTDDQLTLNGAVTFGASFEADAEINAFKLKHFKFAANLEESVDLEVTGEFDGADFKKSKKLSRHNLKTIVFQVAGVPVVIKIDLVIRIGIEGTITAELRAGAEQSADIRLGTRYTDNNGWRSLNDVESSFNVPPPEFNLSSVDARGFAKPELEMTLYGIAGPFLFAKPFVRFDAEKYRSPYWKFSGGLEMGLGFVVKVPILGEVADWEKSLPVFEEQIGTSSNKPPDLEVVSPEDGVTKTAGELVTVEMTASDREQAEVDVTIEGGDGAMVAERTIIEGGQKSVLIPDLCEGTRTWTITAEDDAGATDSVTLSAVVENAAPQVEMAVPGSDGGEVPGAFPGGYLSAGTTVTDARCSEKPTPDSSLVAWYLDGQRIASGRDLVTRLAPDEYAAGDTITLQAGFDDGSIESRSRKVDVTLRQEPAGDQPLHVDITECNVCKDIGTASVNFNGSGESPYEPNEVTLRGYGLDPKNGALPEESLTWEISKAGNGSQRTKVGQGESASFELDELFANPGIAEGTHTIYLTVEDDSGKTASDQAQFTIIIDG